MKFYIALGGIGCKVLENYEENHEKDEEKAFYYVNTEQYDEKRKNYYVLPGMAEGTATLRSIGRNIVNYEIHTGAMSGFFAGIRQAENIDLIFVLSSFGGFGGAAVSPLMDHLEAIVWENLNSCTVIAFNEAAFKNGGFPKFELDRFEANTIEFVSELSARTQGNAEARRFFKKVFNPSCTFYLINTMGMNLGDVWECLDYGADRLRKLDCKSAYTLKKSKKKPDVFISYSSKDQAIADTVADRLLEAGVVPWIATRDIREGSYARQIMQGIREAGIFLVLISENSIASEQVKNEIDRAFSRIKDGMKIIPFILDDSEMDDECDYYLCRQERFFGQKPPVEERIEELVERIREII